ERHPGIDPACQASDKAGPEHQLMADDFRIGRRFLEGAQKELRDAHRQSSGKAVNCSAGAAILGLAFHALGIVEESSQTYCFQGWICSTEKAIGRTSASFCATRRTRFFGANGSRSTLGSSRKAASSTAKRLNRRCTGNCKRKPGSSLITSKSSVGRADGCVTTCRRSGSDANGAG